MPYSWKCETPLSDFETKIDNSYRQKESKAVTVGFELEAPKNTIVLAWTTNPWTLPCNLALAVNENIEYAVVFKNDYNYIVAKNLLPNYFKEIGDQILYTIKGSELVGLKYKPLYPFFTNHLNSFQILQGDFVTLDNGTGIVHLAPGFGEDDRITCEKNGIETLCPIDSAGNYNQQIDYYAGDNVLSIDDKVIKYLKQIKAWYKTEQYLHNR